MGKSEKKRVSGEGSGVDADGMKKADTILRRCDMSSRTDTYLKNNAENLRRITAGCRDDMHEPDEQGVTAKVKGKYFDNAGHPDELIVVIEKGGYHESFRLATLVALARKAKLS